MDQAFDLNRLTCAASASGNTGAALTASLGNHPVSEGSFAADPIRKMVPTTIL